ncbi:Uncharacterised protein [Clostridium cochlearium]|uniref:Uncharacterized protein n=1 Tax=Clostridium cochlearium TaxID=1494 RepID=A0A2X2W3K9_CLOCO|nr:Uncharacterised protein [Clostridium cochlearium]
MTTLGQLVLSIYSLLAIVILIIISVRRIVKEVSEGWELVLLIPILIYLSNMI